MSKKLGRSGDGVSEKGEGVGRKGILPSPHPLPLLLETAATQATYVLVNSYSIRACWIRDVAITSFISKKLQKE